MSTKPYDRIAGRVTPYLRSLLMAQKGATRRASLRWATTTDDTRIFPEHHLLSTDEFDPRKFRHLAYAYSEEELSLMLEDFEDRLSPDIEEDYHLSFDVEKRMKAFTYASQSHVMKSFSSVFMTNLLSEAWLTLQNRYVRQLLHEQYNATIPDGKIWDWHVNRNSVRLSYSRKRKKIYRLHVPDTKPCHHLYVAVLTAKNPKKGVAKKPSLCDNYSCKP